MINPFPHERLNATQIHQIDCFINFCLDDIIDSIDVLTKQDLQGFPGWSKKKLKAKAFKYLTTESEIPAERRALFNHEKLNILGSIEQIRSIFSHPCPENRNGSYPYVAQEAGYSMYRVELAKVRGCTTEREVEQMFLQHGQVVLLNGRTITLAEKISVRHDFIIAKEPEGKLSLTGSEDDFTPYVNKTSVVNYIKKIIDFKIAQISEKESTLKTFLKDPENIDVVTQLLHTDGITTAFLNNQTIEQLIELKEYATALEQLVSEAHISLIQLNVVSPEMRRYIFINARSFVALIRAGFEFGEMVLMEHQLRENLLKNSLMIHKFFTAGLLNKDSLLTKSEKQICATIDNYTGLNASQLDVVIKLLQIGTYTLSDICWMIAQFRILHAFTSKDRDRFIELLEMGYGLSDAFIQWREEVDAEMANERNVDEDDQSRIVILAELMTRYGSDIFDRFGHDLVILGLKTGISLPLLKKMKENKSDGRFNRVQMLLKYLQNGNPKKHLTRLKPAMKLEEAFEYTEQVAKNLSVTYQLISGNFMLIEEAKNISVEEQEFLQQLINQYNAEKDAAASNNVSLMPLSAIDIWNYLETYRARCQPRRAISQSQFTWTNNPDNVISNWWMAPLAVMLPSREIAVVAQHHVGTINIINSERNSISRTISQDGPIDQMSLLANGNLVTGEFNTRTQQNTIRMINPDTGMLIGLFKIKLNLLEIATIGNCILASGYENAHRPALYNVENKHVYSLYGNPGSDLVLVGVGKNKIASLLTNKSTGISSCFIHDYPGIQNVDALEFNISEPFFKMHFIDDKVLAIISTKQIYLYDIQAKIPVCDPIFHGFDLTCSTVTEAGHLALICETGEIHLYRPGGTFAYAYQDPTIKGIKSSQALKHFIETSAFIYQNTNTGTSSNP